MARIRNYGRTWSFAPCTTRKRREIRELVTRARNLRVIGSRHSWSKGIVTDDTVVSLEAMSRLVRVDAENLRATVVAPSDTHELAMFAGLNTVEAPSVARRSGVS